MFFEESGPDFPPSSKSPIYHTYIHTYIDTYIHTYIDT